MYAKCPKCQAQYKAGRTVVRDGHFYRKSDSRWVLKFKCKLCKTYFSQATGDPCFGQKKRRLNRPIFKDLSGSVSMREIARKMSIHRTTVARKKRFLAERSKKWLEEFLKDRSFSWIQFDDMETFEHSKLKPLSNTMVTEAKTRLILGFEVSEMPAKGVLAKRSLEKYGPRPDGRKKGRRLLFERLKPHMKPDLKIESDQNPHYPPDVKAFFPNAEHKRYKGRRGCVVGQGELKAGGYEPLFWFNHTAAMLRANINRLFRRTWCTTKKLEGLVEHIYIYIQAHNQRILAKLAKAQTR